MQQGKPFAWSFSKLKNWRTCPRRHQEIDLKKSVQEIRSPQLKWGDHFHHEIAVRLKNRKLMDPNMAAYEPLAQRYEQIADAQDKKLKVELSLACTRDMRATGYYANDCWLRAKVDLMLINSPVVMVVDWKTGKVVVDSEQLALTAAIVFAHFPDIQWVIAKYVWIAESGWPETTEHYIRGPSCYEVHNGETLAMHSVQTLWHSIAPDLQAMEDAHLLGVYPPNPGRLCKNYCPVKSCEFHGRGSY